VTVPRTAGSAAVQLRRVRFGRPPGLGAPGFPFDIPAIRSLDHLAFETPVTVLVGENGSGKSTLLEALAVAARLPTAGSREAHDDATLEGVRELASRLRLSWSRRTHRGFFLQAEDFFGFARRIATLRRDLERELAEVDRRYADASPLARGLARTPFLRELGALGERYGDGLDARSHGEAFLHFFAERLVPGGLYLLDEPEAPLSPARQLSFIALLNDLVGRGGQIVMATHSPILLAVPGATILSFDHEPLRAVGYEELDHVRLTRDFLNDPQAFLRHL
jgi:predicted ATPase